MIRGTWEHHEQRCENAPVEALRIVHKHRLPATGEA
jgi:hypothetical protein